jgi:hypothetical protein
MPALTIGTAQQQYRGSMSGGEPLAMVSSSIEGGRVEDWGVLSPGDVTVREGTWKVWAGAWSVAGRSAGFGGLGGGGEVEVG